MVHLDFGIEAKLLEPFEHILYLVFILLLIGEVYQYVVKVADSEVINENP
jgi:hypothetical protein